MTTNQPRKPHCIECVVTLFALLVISSAYSQTAQAQWATNGNDINNTNSGNVGVGTTTPSFKLDVSGSTNSPFRVRDNAAREYFSTTTRAGTYGTTPVVTISGRLIVENNGPDGGNDTLLRRPINSLVIQPADYSPYHGYFIVRQAGGGYILMIDQNPSGNVGINTAPSSQYKLSVNGDTNVTGNINITGNINAKYQDIAEWVPAAHELPAGTVVTLDPTKSNHVTASSQAYDTRVAGVISAQPGLALGERAPNKILVATTGRVKIKVDATAAAIQVGDLLVTSSVPGVAMKSQPISIGDVQIHRPGTLIGKALEPLAKGQGEILILLSLQ